MADLETIKVLLRSLLISSPHPLTIEELRRDYKKSEGQDCPFLALGYKTWISFLQSLPDTIQILPNGLCKPVSTKETQHIQNMVALQKKSKRRPFRGPPPPRYSSSYSGSSRYGSQRYNNGPSHIPSRGRDRQEDMDRFFKTAQEEKQKIRMEQLKSSEPTSRSAPNSERAESPYENNVTYRPAGDLCEDSDSSMDSFCDRFEYVRPSSPICRKNELGELPNCKENPPNSICDNRFQTNYSQDNFKSENEIDDSLFPTSSSKVSDVLKRNLRTILRHNPDGIWACVLPEKYHEEFGLSLDWSELGYNSVCQMAHDLPDVFICKRIKSGDWKLFDAQRPLPVAYLDDQSSSEVPMVPEAVCHRISSLAKQYPSGITAKQFDRLYQEKYHKILMSEVPGCKDVEALLLSLQDLVVHLRYVLKECFVYPVMNETDQDESPFKTLDKKMIQELGLYPDEVFGPDDSYPAAVLPDDLSHGQYVELIVAEVYNPHRFWVQLRKTNTLLDKLMDQLQDFYSHHGDKYKMPESTLCPGQCCAAIYCNEWHRACIKSLHGANAEVFYVDYGTLIKVPKEELRFIHKDFCQLPKQAVRASLFGIQPPDGKKRFSDEANKAFLGLVTGKPLVGLIYNVNFDVPSLQLFLIDTSGSSDIHLNDVLVKEKHADFIAELLEGAPSIEERTISAPTENSKVSDKPQPQSSPEPKPPAQKIPSVSEQLPQSAPSQAWSGSRSSCLPPPGFHPSNIYNQARPQVSMSGLGSYNSGFVSTPSTVTGVTMPATNLNPLATNVNPALAAYSQVVSAVAMQQQHQAMLLAMYQSFFQQNMTTNMLNSQQKPGNLAAPMVGNPWLGNPLMYPQRPSVVPPNLINSPVSKTPLFEPNISKTESCLTAPELQNSTIDFSSSTADTNSEAVNHCTPSSEVSDTGSVKSVKKKKSKKKTGKASQSMSAVSPSSIALGKNNLKPTINSTEVSGMTKQGMSTINHEEVSQNSLNSRSKNHQVNVSITQPSIKTDSLNTLSPAENEDHVVDCWEELADKTIDPDDSSSTSSIVVDSSSSYGSAISGMTENLRYLNMSPQLSTQLNFWKEIDFHGKKMHVFNIEKKGFMSTDELAQQCTNFSNSSSIVRVVEAKGITIPFLKLVRSQNLPLFSALDGCNDDMVSRFGLVRNKNGNITGTFHLTPINNIPSVLMIIGIYEDSLIEGFQVLRDEFADDPYWK